MSDRRVSGGCLATRRLVAALLVALGAGTAPDHLAAQQAPEAVWQFTYLKALPGRVADLERFLDANWFAMDRRAVAAGHLVDFQLLRGTPADSSWDLLEITVFRDSLQHAQADSVYRTIYRPAHARVLIDGRGLPELGRIVRSETLRRVAGAGR